MKLSRKPDCVLSDIKKQLLAITDIDSKCAKELEGVHFIRWEEGDEYGTRKFGSLITKAAVFLIVSGGLKLLFCGEEKVYGPGDLFLVGTSIPLSYEHVTDGKEPFLAIEVDIDVSDIEKVLEYLDEKYFQFITNQPTKAFTVTKADANVLTVFQDLAALAESDLEERIAGQFMKRFLYLRIFMTSAGSSFSQLFRPDRVESKVRVAADLIVDHIADKQEPSVISEQIDLKPSLYHHYFKEVMGVPPGQFRKWCRVTEARRLMIDDGLPATQACYKLGYDNLTYFIIQFKQVFKCTPGKFIQDELQSYPWQQLLIREGYKFK